MSVHKQMPDASLRRSDRAERFRASLTQRTLPKVEDRLVCKSCNHDNGSERVFCAQCGEVLWQECVECGALGAASESFCGACGCHIAQSEQKAYAAHEARLHEARQLFDAARFPEAKKLIRQVAALEDLRFDPLIQEALSLLDQIAATAAHWEKRVDQVCTEAGDMITKREHAKALDALHAIPEPCRTSKLRTLITAARSGREQFERILRDIKELVKAKDVLKLAPAVTVLLKLDPDHTQGRQLAQQVSEKLAALAKAQIRQRDYAKALEILDLTPSAAVTDETRKLIGHARQLTWLQREVDESPVVDNVLPHVVDRYCKLVPNGNGDSTDLAQQLQTKRAAEPKGSGPFPAWAPPPETSLFGGRIEWLGKTATEPSGADARTLWDQHPGEFFVAAGLALQGVHPVHVNTDLLKSVRSSSRLSLSSLSKWGRKSRGTRTAWGVDIGNHSIKAVQVETGDDGPVRILQAFHTPYPEPLSRPDRAHQADEQIAEALKALNEKAKFEKTDTIFLSLTSQSVLARYVQFPEMAPKQAAQAVEMEARHQMPIPLEDLAWDYCTVGSQIPEAERSKPRPSTLLLAAKKTIAEQRLRTVEEALQVPVAGIQPDTIAQLNWFIHDRVGNAFEDPKAAPVAILDVGSQKTMLTIATPTSVWFRSSGAGGDRFTQTLARAFSLTFQQAERVKTEPWRAKNLSKVFLQLEPDFTALSDEVTRSLDAYGAQFGQLPGTLWVCGGGFRIHGLYRHLLHGPHFPKQ